MSTRKDRRVGSMLAGIAREAGGLTDAEAEAIDQLRDKTPAEPMRFDDAPVGPDEGAASMNCRYEIEARPAELGGGWRLRLIENGEEVGGGVFPLAEYADAQEPEKAAYADAQAEGEAWVVSR